MRSRTMAPRSMFIGARPIRTPSSFALRMPAKLSRVSSPIRVQQSSQSGLGRDVPADHWYLCSLAGDEDDAQTVEFVHDLQEVLHASRDPVERSDEYDREFLPPCIRDERVEPRTSGSAS